MEVQKSEIKTVGQARAEELEKLVIEYRRTLEKTPKSLKANIEPGGKPNLKSDELSNLEFNALLAKSTGTVNPAAQRMMINQAVGSVPKKSSQLDQLAINGSLETLQSLAPDNEIESMLNLQIVSLHNLGMELIQNLSNLNAVQNKTIDSDIKRVKSLFTLFQKAVALRHKIKHAEQRIQVQHVHVSEGGQAVIGNVSK